MFSLFADIKNKISTPSQSTKEIVESLKQGGISTIMSGVTSNDGFNFSSYCGTYTYDGTSWQNSNTPTDKIIVKLDIISADGTTKEAVFTWSKYEEQIVLLDDEQQLIPVKIEAEITIDNIKVASVDYSLTWDNENEMPKSASLNIFVKPFTLQLSFNSSNNKIEFNATLLKLDTKILDIHAELALSSSQTVIASGYVVHGDFKYTISIQNLEQMGSIDKEDMYAQLLFLNNNVVGDIQYKNSKVASLKFKISDDKIIPYWEFNNGSTLDFGLNFDDFSFEK